METLELKQEINQVIEKWPEESLRDLLAYLRQTEAVPAETVRRQQLIRKIMAEDRELLARLAQ
jgi:hypothetical protein